MNIALDILNRFQQQTMASSTPLFNYQQLPQFTQLGQTVQPGATWLGNNTTQNLASFFRTQNSWTQSPFDYQQYYLSLLLSRIFGWPTQPIGPVWPPRPTMQTATQMWSELGKTGVPARADGQILQTHIHSYILNKIGAFNVNNPAAIQQFLTSHPFLGLSYQGVLDMTSPQPLIASDAFATLSQRLAAAIVSKADQAFIPLNNGIHPVDGLLPDGLISQTEFFAAFGGSTQLLPPELAAGVTVPSTDNIDAFMQRPPLSYTVRYESLPQTGSRAVYRKNGRDFIVDQESVTAAGTVYTFREVTRAPSFEDQLVGKSYNDITVRSLLLQNGYTFVAAESTVNPNALYFLPPNGRMVFQKGTDKIHLTITNGIVAPGIVHSGIVVPVNPNNFDVLRTMSSAEALAWLRAPERGLTFSFTIGDPSGNGFSSQYYITNDRRLLNVTFENGRVTNVSLSQPNARLSAELGSLEGQNFVSTINLLKTRYRHLNPSVSPPQAASFGGIIVDGKRYILSIYPGANGEVKLATLEEDRAVSIN